MNTLRAVNSVFAVAALGWSSPSSAADVMVSAAAGGAVLDGRPVSIEPTPRAGTSTDHSRKNHVFFELLGNGGVYSINYERFLGDTGPSVRTGISVFDCESSGSLVRIRFAAVTSPWLASYHLGAGNHKLQLGAGATIVYSYGDDRQLSVLGTAVVGYRYLPEDSAFTFGIGFTPLVRLTSVDAIPLFGVSVGGKF